MKPHIIIARLLSQYTVIYRSRRNMNFFGNLSNVPRDIIGTKSIPYQNYNLSIAGHSKGTNIFVGKTTDTINLVFDFRVYAKLNLEFQGGEMGQMYSVAVETLTI